MAKNERLEQLVERFCAADRLALARIITLVESGGDEVAALMEQLYGRTGRACVIGVTGSPGAGKSTLVNRMVAGYRQGGRSTAVVAVDPSSPFSGGSVLGDRVRMTEHWADPGVFIRSLSTRGWRGGLSRAARDVVRLLDAFGFDVVLIETVGVGQTELAIMDLADTTVVVTVPEGGDAVQVMKAGLNEIADLFVVNKSDRDGAGRLKAELQLSVELSGNKQGWRPPVLLTSALRNEGISELLDAVDRHIEFVRAGERAAAQAQRRVREFLDVLLGEIERRAGRAAASGAEPAVLALVREGRLNPYAAARRVLEYDGALAQVLGLGRGQPAAEPPASRQ